MPQQGKATSTTSAADSSFVPSGRSFGSTGWKNIPEGVIAIEVDEPAARKLFGQTISIHYFSETFTHTVGTVNGAYWFKVDVGTAPDDDDVEEEPQ